jgi:hypothetical protein
MFRAEWELFLPKRVRRSGVDRKALQIELIKNNPAWSNKVVIDIIASTKICKLIINNI